ncbi:MAG: LysM peptidoglycan-binding domain-containing protein [Clostridiales bacterium]|nr:LysM peptidoglycan-binding domain-containing protein [Clostridiales bacterium]
MRFYEENDGVRSPGAAGRESGKQVKSDTGCFSGTVSQISSEYGEKPLCNGIIHVIQPGDTLYHLSEKYHVSVSEIMYKNPYANVYNLRAGDEICIPISGRKRL